ncbi:hypothetical protein [Francisella uliginis]|uniref:Uncharacterized protein n=1 Tax=Francisella uliginis TaxID=573570 RepID=A0A1L4BQ16_9GAMM|nr:hypothetical protein [Francisella uliginis]API85929.1 hypothetical protein F7310_00530 [Francisella uliginis]
MTSIIKNKNKLKALRYILLFIIFSIIIGHFLAAIALALYAIQQYLLRKLKPKRPKLWESISSIIIVLVAIVLPVIYKAGYTTYHCDNVKDTLSEIFNRVNNNSLVGDSISFSNIEQIDFSNNTRTCQAKIFINKKPIGNTKYIIENKGFNRNLVRITSFTPSSD